MATWSRTEECEVAGRVEILDVEIAVFAERVSANDYFEHAHFRVCS